MLRMNIVLLVLACAAISCGGDDTKDSGTPAGDAASYANSCIDLTGTWTLANHCSSALIGMTVAVTQDKCHATTGPNFPGLSGDIAADGTFNISGMFGGATVTCVGTATDKKITESCTPGNCAVVLTR
jgi:hypothetical protein